MSMSNSKHEPGSQSSNGASITNQVLLLLSLGLHYERATVKKGLVLRGLWSWLSIYTNNEILLC